MTFKPTFAALIVAGLIAGCTSQTPVATGPAPLGLIAGQSVPAGIACEQLVETLVNKVAGCEGFVPMRALSADQAAEIALLNTKLAAEASPVVNFDFNKDGLTPKAAAVVDAQAVWMLRYRQVRFSVFGHTDLVGSEGYNFALAKRRAETVVARLISRGVAGAQLDALVSYGKTRPLIDTIRPEETNRRTVTEVTGYLETPRLYSTVPVDCAWIQPPYLPSHPVCVAEPTRAVLASPPPPAPPKPIGTQSWDTAVSQPSVSTSASITYDGGTKTSQANSTAGDTKTSVKVDETGGIRTVSINGQVVATSNLDGTNLQAVQH